MRWFDTSNKRKRDQLPEAFLSSTPIRIPGQIRAIREAYGTAVHHIHLIAAEDELEKRYAQRGCKRWSLLPMQTYGEVGQKRTLAS